MGLPILFKDDNIMSMICSRNNEIKHFFHKPENKEKVDLKPVL